MNCIHNIILVKPQINGVCVHVVHMLSINISQIVILYHLD